VVLLNEGGNFLAQLICRFLVTSLLRHYKSVLTSYIYV
jgi:hypothetical protein